MTLTDQEIYTAMRKGGFPILQSIVTTAVALRESGGIPDVLNDDPETGDLSYGLLQINWAVPEIVASLTKHGITDPATLKDPVTNARAGVILWNNSNANLDVLWYINRPGPYQDRYNSFLPRAVAAALATTPIVVNHG